MSCRKIKVAVVRGGPSAEYEVSLNTGKQILKHLSREKYQPIDVTISKSGEWIVGGLASEPEKIFRHSSGAIDVVFNAMHGEFGEDGKAQQVFESLGVPYTGSMPVPSFFAMQKHIAREIFRREGIKIPRATVFRKGDFHSVASEIFKSMPPLWVVKPASRGSSVGVSICGGFSELIEGLEKAFLHDDTIIAEEYIKGSEATCGVLENYRNKNYYVLPPIEIIPSKGSFFDYQNKYDGSTKEICPAGFSKDVKRELEEIAVKAHRVLGARHYSRSDFVVSKKGIYLLETNTLPGLTAESLFPKAARAAGLEFSALLDHLIGLALNKTKPGR